ncbi:phage tail sheath family protein [Falsiroseomonas sp. HW251]|uniref:phage tail sheath family protein n=1 Tax=Falsiroseomonas sp. HW251 TaxID=3390998 RepID=UPI003D31135E
MPEYLAPGVFVEEVSFRSKSIEGVPTSTTGFVGPTRFGPLPGANGVRPRLVTSFTEYERVHGGLDPLLYDDGTEVTNYLAHAVRAFFANGGKRLYIARTFNGSAAGATAKMDVATSSGTARWHARWPGRAGNVLVNVRPVRSKNIAIKYAADPDDILQRSTWGVQLQRARAGAVVELINPLPALPKDLPKQNAPLDETRLFVVQVDANGKQSFVNSAGATVALPDAIGDMHVYLVELQVEVRVTPDRLDTYTELAAHPDQRRYVGKVLEQDDPADEDAVVRLEWTPDLGVDPFAPARLMAGLTGTPNKRLGGGTDGAAPPQQIDIEGKEADPDNAKITATGLNALGEIDDIAIVAVPAAGGNTAKDVVMAIAGSLIGHAERCRYRIAVVDGEQGSSINEIRNFRGGFDSKYAALYHPWIEILDPLSPQVPGVPLRRLLLPPSGFVTGIYARNDVERGVHKAPANEVVRGLTRFEININTPRQEVLNPEGINCLRFFDGRGNRVWGARTMSSDPEWKYVNVRRLFIYVEHSLDKATQWAVFEPNNERLWRNIRQTVEDFLFVLWRDGALIGDKPEQAYFVRCDRTTMTQNDLDNGRMICLVGIAPSRPAEFVIFRVGQWTADQKS